MIYFIQEGRNGAIKIGYSNDNVKKRLEVMQSATSKPLHLIGTIEGTMEQEKALHSIFNPYIIRGEWFEPHPKLISYLLNLSGFSLKEEALNINVIKEGFTLTSMVEKYEIHLLKQALYKCNGLKKKAAEVLGISFRQLRYLTNQKYKEHFEDLNFNELAGT